MLCSCQVFEDPEERQAGEDKGPSTSRSLVFQKYGKYAVRLPLGQGVGIGAVVQSSADTALDVLEPHGFAVYVVGITPPDKRSSRTHAGSISLPACLGRKPHQSSLSLSFLSLGLAYTVLTVTSPIAIVIPMSTTTRLLHIFNLQVWSALDTMHCKLLKWPHFAQFRRARAQE